MGGDGRVDEPVDHVPSLDELLGHQGRREWWNNLTQEERATVLYQWALRVDPSVDD